MDISSGDLCEVRYAMNRVEKSVTSGIRNPRSGVRIGIFLATGILLVSVLGIFGTALTTDQVFVFRDAAHFYYPLFEWTANQWQLGQVPLWNPLEDLGAPVVADSTSSVFYPGKLLFFLPGPFGFWYKAFIVIHVLLCGLTSFRLARHWHCHVSAATLAAVSYALSGNVLFQYCNVVYLVGAAWLPAAILTGDRLIKRGGAGNAVRLAFCLAMMVLGGDAQSAYHAGIMLVGLAWLSRRAGNKGEEPGFKRKTVRLILAASLAIGLAGVQWLPSANWIGSSTRASHDAPRNVYEFGRSCLKQDGKANFGPTLLGVTQPGHHSNVFEFSVGPWRFIELLWPNVGGKMFPQNQRWMNAIPAEGRVWTPTLYMGLLPVLLASLSFRLRGGSARRRFLSWCALLSALAGLGGYGVGWLLSEIHYDLGGSGELPVGAPFGGLYWLLTVVLPGYVYFRYPAKLWIIGTLAISQLAAASFDRAAGANGRARVRLMRRIAVLAIVSALFARFAPTNLGMWLSDPANVPFGPLDIRSVQPQMMASMVHTTLLACGILTIVWFNAADRKIVPRRWILVFLTAFELVVAHQWLVPLAPIAAMKQTHFAAIRRRAPRPVAVDSNVPIRFFRGITSWYPRWVSHRSSTRLEEVLWWNNVTLYPKHHLDQGLGVVTSRSSLRSAHQDELFAAVFKTTGAKSLPVQFLKDLGVSCQITSEPGGPEPLPAEPGYWSTKTHISQNLQQFARVHLDTSRPPRRVWIVNQIEWVPPVDPRENSALASYCERITRSTSEPILRDLQSSAVAESPTTPELPEFELSSRAAPSERIDENRSEIIHYSEQRVDLAAQLMAPGLVLLNDTYTAGWKAFVTQKGRDKSRQVPIYRTNGIMRGVYLPAGNFKIEMRYEPKDFYLGATISAVSWIACLLYLVVHFRLQFIGRFRTHT